MTPPRDMKDRAKRMVLRGVLDRLRPLAYTKIASGIRCLTFHYQFPDEQDNASKLFAALKREGDFITTAELLALLDGTATRQGRLFHLSIDDGFENIATEAHPLLKGAEIPYSLMVCPKFVGAREADAEAFSKNAQYARPLPLAGWEELAALARDGVEIGAHTQSHLEVSTLSASELDLEVSECRNAIETKLGMPCTSFAWPFGRISAMTEEAIALAQNSGYRAIFSSVRGLLQPGQGVPRYLPRDHFEPGWPVDTVVYYATREAPLFEPPVLPATRR
jgi:peptidoglycan/xylan/chitin deacetylase (PgdA/CDA1 family)